MKSKDITILGLNDSNSAAAIIKNGVLIAAAREERFDRIKFSDSYPTKAVDYCLKSAGISVKELDHIVFAWNPGHEIEPQDTAAAQRYHKNFLHYIPNNLLRHIGGDKSNKKIESIRQEIKFSQGNIDLSFLPHHACHAASTFFLSPYSDAAILTLDGYGDDITTQFFIGKKNTIKSIGRTLYPHSLGQVYAAITQYLGYRANSDEWKVMGLAPYGEPKFYNLFEDLIRFDDDLGELRINLDYFMYYVWHPRRYSDEFIKRFGPERYPGDEIKQYHINIAASFQKRVEDVVIEMCNYLHSQTSEDTLCLAGGVSMNSKMNGRIALETPFKNIWIPSSSDDAGTSVGACFYFWNQILGHKREFILENDYWGPEYTNDEIKKILDGNSLKYSYIENIELEAAKSLAAGKVIGWHQGRMELGQRALGNRSILGDPRNPGMKDKINKLIKHREWYRPFAPSVLEEYQDAYFEGGMDSPFMQLVFPIRAQVRDLIPAVTHIDGSGRVQTVSKKSNMRYWKLINEFRKLTNIPMLLNTSFNDNDEPVVCSPKDAIRTFFGTGLEELYIGNFKITKL
jgi:carbamoyltransferase